MMLEFIRPEAFYLTPLLIALVIWQLTNKRHNTNNNPIAPHLARFLLDGESKQKEVSNLWISLFMFVAMLALAGPSWQSQPLPVYQSKRASVLVMDMTRSMYSQDIKPNRLTQARFKALTLTDILQENELALVAYSNDAYTISPLTSDHQTLANLIPSLSPEIMPVPGSNAYSGINLAVDLLNQAGAKDGEIYWLTDGIDDFDESDDILGLVKENNIKLNIYAVATEQGAPIQLPQQGFLKDNYGQIVIPKANFAQLRQLAINTQGQFNFYQFDDSDLSIFTPNDLSQTQVELGEHTSEQPIDGGIYLVFLLLPIGYLMLKNQPTFLSLVCCLMLFYIPNSYAFTLPSWLQNSEQKAYNAYQQEQYDKASTAADPSLSGAAYYQRSEYDKALEKFKLDNTAQGFYNQGNALAKLQQFDAAIEAYEQALKRQPDFQQAADNKALLEELMKQQQDQQQNNNQEQESDSDQKDQKQEQKNDQQQGDPNQQKSDQQSQKGDNEQSDSQQEQQEQQQNNEQADQQQDKQQQQQDNQESQESETGQAKPTDTEAQQQAIEQGEVKPLTAEEKEQLQMINQLLRKVPDDPAILLRNKMQLESQKRTRQRIRQQGVEKSW